MKIRIQWVLLAFIFATLNTSHGASLTPLPEQAQAAHLSAEILSRYHYKPLKLDDALSSKIFDQYLESLDGEKVLFLRADIERFASSRTQFDDAILGEDLSVPFAIFNLYQQRITERLGYARTLLKHGFDFKIKESYEFNRKRATWAKSEAELNTLWRKRVKNDWLRLKLAGKDDKHIIETLDKRYENSLKSLSKVNSNDAFERFMNVYAMTVDPHTNYLGVRASEEFDISMKLSLFGIGAVLYDRDEYITIRELVAGGPAALSGKLNPGDRIVGVGQGDDGPITEILGWRIDDAVALIRGPEDTVVRLDILPAEANMEGDHKQIPLVRKKITLEKQAAKKTILEIKDGQSTRRIGVIDLPGFYLDFAARQNGDKDYKSASRDVSLLLGELKKEKVDGVVIDLRNNGGGSLFEAIELTGLFIDQGPVVQQRNAEGKVFIENDTHAGVAWDGPLGVLINRASASASEIFAAAIQDYGRGIVIGESSFGKGTVQTVADLDNLVKSKKPTYGGIKMTIAQFFRINGGTTQLRGVTPDISLPTMTDAKSFGESSFENALPWTQISAATYTPVADLSGLLPKLKKRHDKRIKNDRDFQYLLEDIAEINTLRKKSSVSLNEAERRKEREAKLAREKSRDLAKGSEATADSGNHILQDDGLLASERNLRTEKAIEEASQKAKDIWLKEAAHIISDQAGMRKGRISYAARK